MSYKSLAYLMRLRILIVSHEEILRISSEKSRVVVILEHVIANSSRVYKRIALIVSCIGEALSSKSVGLSSVAQMSQWC